MIVDIINKQRKEKVNKNALDFVCNVMQEAGKILQLDAKCELSIAIVGEKKIRVLNRDYRAQDCVTDVLSFALEEGEELYQDKHSLPNEIRVLGDIIIAMPRVIAQAEEYGHSKERELAYLAVHGLLHLVGYDHECEKDKVKMRLKEEQILQSVGVLR